MSFADGNDIVSNCQKCWTGQQIKLNKWNVVKTKRPDLQTEHLLKKISKRLEDNIRDFNSCMNTVSTHVEVQETTVARECL